MATSKSNGAAAVDHTIIDRESIRRELWQDEIRNKETDIEQITKSRDDFLQQANVQVGMFNGAIQTHQRDIDRLKKLVDPSYSPPSEQSPSSDGASQTEPAQPDPVLASAA